MFQESYRKLPIEKEWMVKFTKIFYKIKSS